MPTVIITSKSKSIQAYVRERMKQEIEERGFDPWGSDIEQVYERECLDLEEVALNNPEIDWDVKLWELKNGQVNFAGEEL